MEVKGLLLFGRKNYRYDAADEADERIRFGTGDCIRIPELWMYSCEPVFIGYGQAAGDEG